MVDKDTVDAASQRRNTSTISLDNQTILDLNEYFGELCTDKSYSEPKFMDISMDCKIPEISERLVWNTLRSLKRTATGPHQIPYWIWKDQAEIFTPIIITRCNLSFSTQTWPKFWKRPNINPLPKVDTPKEKGDFRRINITPVIARAFERAVYMTHAKRIVEDNLSNTQLYATGRVVAVLMP